MRVIADVDAIALLGLLDAASERAGRAVAYPRLLAMLAAVAQGTRAQSLRSAAPTPAPPPAAPSMPASPERALAAPPLSPQLRLVRLTDDVFASRRAVEEYNRAAAAAQAAARDAAAVRERGVTPKVGARPLASLRPDTPAAAQADVCPLAARKAAEAASDRERVARLRAQLAAEEAAAAAMRAERQRLLRAALDAQVAERQAAALNARLTTYSEKDRRAYA